MQGSVVFQFFGERDQCVVAAKFNGRHGGRFSLRGNYLFCVDEVKTTRILGKMQ